MEKLSFLIVLKILLIINKVHLSVLMLIKSVIYIYLLLID